MAAVDVPVLPLLADIADARNLGAYGSMMAVVSATHRINRYSVLFSALFSDYSASFSALYAMWKADLCVIQYIHG